MEKNIYVWIYVVVVLIAFCTRIAVSARSEQEMRERFYGNLVNSTAPNSGEGSIAKMFDRVLEKEFQENDQPEGFDFLYYCCFYLIQFHISIRFAICYLEFSLIIVCLLQ